MRKFRDTLAGEYIAMQVWGVGRCFVCRRPWIRHTPARFNRCMNTPLDLRLTDQGRARAQQAGRS